MTRIRHNQDGEKTTHSSNPFGTRGPPQDHLAGIWQNIAADFKALFFFRW